MGWGRYFSSLLLSSLMKVINVHKIAALMEIPCSVIFETCPTTSLSEYARPLSARVARYIHLIVLIMPINYSSNGIR